MRHRPAAIGQIANVATDIEVVRDSLVEPSAKLDGTRRKPVAERNRTGCAAHRQPGTLIVSRLLGQRFKHGAQV
jgi:hypothetical protein